MKFFLHLQDLGVQYLCRREKRQEKKMIATARIQNIANDQMRSINAEEAWTNDMAARLYNIDADGLGRAWEPTELIGSKQEVVIPNGLTGENYEERQVAVFITAEMVAEAERLAKTF